MKLPRFLQAKRPGPGRQLAGLTLASGLAFCSAAAAVDAEPTVLDLTGFEGEVRLVQAETTRVIQPTKDWTLANQRGNLTLVRQKKPAAAVAAVAAVSDDAPFWGDGCGAPKSPLTRSTGRAAGEVDGKAGGIVGGKVGVNVDGRAGDKAYRGAVGEAVGEAGGDATGKGTTVEIGIAPMTTVQARHFAGRLQATAPLLAPDLELAGGKAELGQVSGGALTVRGPGSMSIRQALEQVRLVVDGEGSVHVLGGNTEELTATLQGSGTIRHDGLVQHAILSASGEGAIRVNRVEDPVRIDQAGFASISTDCGQTSCVQ